MDVHLVDGTYELFRAFYSPGSSHADAAGTEVGATRRLVGSMLSLLEGGATHVGIATDYVIESFRNDLWPTYKTGEGIDPVLWSQFRLAEEACVAAGFTVWPMVEVEADDALAAAARVAAADARVARVLICSPDKDLFQCVDDAAGVVVFDRRRDTISDRAATVAKFGIEPASIPDYLALVGDSADGFPGLIGWGAKSAATVLARYGHLEAVPIDADVWEVSVRSAAKLARTLAEDFAEALLFRRIATLETGTDLATSVDELAWAGPRAGFGELAERLDAPGLAERAAELARVRAG